MENIIDANQIDLKDDAGRLRVRLTAIPSGRPSITLYGEEQETLELAMTRNGGEIVFQRRDGTRAIALTGDAQGGEFIIRDSTGAPAFVIRMSETERVVEVFHPEGGSWRIDAHGETGPSWKPATSG
jgi:hypothetical protein